MINKSSIQLSDLSKIAQEIIQETKDFPRVWLLEGEMGAGKTTFTAALVKAMGSLDAASSPTFSLINEYALENGRVIYHFDLYRTKNLQEIVDLGIYDYLDSGDLCIIEWPSKGEELWDIPHLLIKLSINTDKTRNISIESKN
ncbi:MAG: hypothetical protein RIR51_367 [Bacteroidota bacterium]|jgi:tRNA threonylcarbamoyladenosine biosynthesis protein TsaE